MTAPRPVLALIGLDLRLLGRGALVLIGLVAGLSAAVVAQYAVTFTSAAEVRGLEMLAGNPAVRILFGVPRALDTAGGFTVWRTGLFAAVAVAAWALASGTRLTRGEEDAGHAWLSLAGTVRLRSAVVLHLLVVDALVLLLAAATGTAMFGAGAGGAGALVYVAGLAGVGCVFASLGVGCGQLLGERRAATGLAAAVLTVALLVKMVGDGADRVWWLSWLSPFGLASLSQPYAAQRWGPLAILWAAALLLGVGALLAAAHRDVGAGLVDVRPARAPRPRLLRSLGRFAIRRSLPAVVGWSAALAAYFLLLGGLAATLTDFLTANRRFVEIAAQAGFDDLARVEGYAASLFLLLPVPLGLFAASRLAHAAADEVGGPLVLLLARPVGRIRWALAQTVVTAAAMLTLTLVSASAFWLGTVVTGAGLHVAAAVAGALNVVPVALLALGGALLGLGFSPHLVTPSGAVPVVGGFVIWVLAGTLGWPDWLGKLSPFAHLASVPASAPDVDALMIMLAIAVVLGTVGVLRFGRRDLGG